MKQKESFIHEMVGLTVKLTFVYNELISFIKTILPSLILFPSTVKQSKTKKLFTESIILPYIVAYIGLDVCSLDILSNSKLTQISTILLD